MRNTGMFKSASLMGRCVPGLVLGLYCLGVAPVAARQAEQLTTLYQSQTIVTGQRDETRLPGFAVCLEYVVKKVSGNARLDMAKFTRLTQGHARDYVLSYTERDRYGNRPIHDEQGTRDRPFDLVVKFNPDKINTLLQQLGEKPWLSQRPALAIFLSVRNRDVSYILTQDAFRGIDQREAFHAAADRMGLAIILPTQADIAAAGLTPGQLQTERSEALLELAHKLNADDAIAGNMAWDLTMRGWQAEWQLVTESSQSRWQVSNVNFDEAFRNAMAGAAKILSGNGLP